MFRRGFLQPVFLLFAISVFGQQLPPSGGDFSQAPLNPIPADVILVKGAEPSASDHVTPLPEEGAVIKNVYQNRYLGISLPLPDGWVESFKGPPPSDHGLYVLANILPGSTFRGPIKGTLLFSAQDMFFVRAPAKNAKELIAYKRDHLESYYKVEREPAEVTIAGHRFERFDYGSPVAQLHWIILATQIRCHAVEFIFSSRDPKLLESVVETMSRMTLDAPESPICVANYASGDNVIEKVDPVLKDRRFNAIPVRIMIDRKGRVEHVHVISAFPDQAEIITRALMQWKFKPYLRDGKPAEVETGLMFGYTPHASPGAASVVSSQE